MADKMVDWKVAQRVEQSVVRLVAKMGDSMVGLTAATSAEMKVDPMGACSAARKVARSVEWRVWK